MRAEEAPRTAVECAALEQHLVVRGWFCECQCPPERLAPGFLLLAAVGKHMLLMVPGMRAWSSTLSCVAGGQGTGLARGQARRTSGRERFH